MQASCSARQRALRPHRAKSRSQLFVHWIISRSDASTIGGGETFAEWGKTARAPPLTSATPAHANATPIKPFLIVFEPIMCFPFSSSRCGRDGAAVGGTRVTRLCDR